MELRPHLLARGDAWSRCASCEADRGRTSTSARSTRPRAPGSQRRSTSSARAGLLDGLRSSSSIGAGAYIAARRRRCSSRWRAGARCRGCRPPFPRQVGYLGRPTLINNVETLAHIPAILRNGGEWWAGSGRAARRNAALVGHAAPSRGRAATRRRSGSRRASSSRSYAAASPTRSGAIVPGGAASGILPPAALDAPLTRDGAARVGRRRRLGRRAGLPGVVLPAPPARRDDALLRRGVVPEVHAVPDRQPRAPPPLRGARARASGDDAREGRRVAARDGEDVDLRPRPGARRSRSGTRCALAGAVRAAGAREQ